MGEEYILAIDLGTTNCKTLLLNRLGRIAHKETEEYPLHTPYDGWSEQNPEDWWYSVKNSIKRVAQKVAPESIKAIGISGQMHGLVLLDKTGKVLRPAILWNDQRSYKECDEVYRTVGGKENLLSFTNNPIIPGYTGSKLLWVKSNEPFLFEAAAHFLLPKDYIRFCLTGDYGTDISDASGTGIFDVRNRIWAFDLIHKFHLPDELFPRVWDSEDIIGGVPPQLAEELNLPKNVPVIAGGGDAVMQTIGSAATTPEKCLIVVGTGGNVTVSLPEFAENPNGKLQSFCHCVPGMWVEMGVTLSAGNSLRWFRDNLAFQEVMKAKELEVSPYELLGELASSSPAGAGGVLFLPYLQGERCPHVDVHASGTFIGIKINTDRADLVRSVMEGVAFSLRDVLEIISSTGVEPDFIHLSGGGASSSLWRQIHADILNREVRTLAYAEDASAVGAAIVAGVKIGFWSNIEEAVQNIKVKTINAPQDNNVRLYQELYEVYRDLYPALKSSYKRLGIAGSYSTNLTEIISV